MDNSENKEEIKEEKKAVEPTEKKAAAGGEEKKADQVKHRRLSNYERHLVPCPHCGKDILDHFTECPHCGGAVEPLGYHGDEKKIARIKRITTVIGVVLSIGLIAAIIAVTYVRNKDKTDVVAPLDAQTAIVREIDF